jgi:hypothetical protein
MRTILITLHLCLSCRMAVFPVSEILFPSGRRKSGKAVGRATNFEADTHSLSTIALEIADAERSSTS